MWRGYRVGTYTKINDRPKLNGMCKFQGRNI